jgi:hypothetical protein
VPKEVDPRILGRLADFVGGLEDPEATLVRLWQSVRNDPCDADSFNELGMLLEERGELQAAAFCYVHALHARLDFPAAEFNLVCVRQRLFGGTL